MDAKQTAPGTPNDLELIRTRVQEGLNRVKLQSRALERRATTMQAGGIVASAGATLIAGVTAAAGPVVGAGPEGWRLACAAAAACAFASTVFLGLNQQLKLSERLLECSKCLGELRSLELAILTGSRPWSEIASGYEQVLKTYPGII